MLNFALKQLVPRDVPVSASRAARVLSRSRALHMGRLGAIRPLQQICFS